MTLRPLVVAATEEEARYVPSSVELVICGVGKIAAAFATTRALLTAGDPAGRLVVNIGTAGALRDELTGMFEPGVVLNHDLSADAIRALGYDPKDELQIGDSDVVLATGDVFVTDPAVRDELATRAHLVDMEGFAVAYAAQRLGAYPRLVKHVSDSADEGAMEWPALVDASAREIGRWLEQHL